MLRSRPRRNFGSTSPLFSRYTSRFGESVYPENNGEALPKLQLGRERNMEANPSTHRGLSKKRGQSKRDTVTDMH